MQGSMSKQQRSLCREERSLFVHVEEVPAQGVCARGAPEAPLSRLGARGLGARKALCNLGSPKLKKKGNTVAAKAVLMSPLVEPLPAVLGAAMPCKKAGQL